MGKTALGITVALLIAAAAGGGFLFGQKQSANTGATGVPGGANVAAKPTGTADSGVVVEAAKVAKVSLPQGITAVGSLRSDESITVRPEVAGRISGILFKEGQRVASGTPLVKLDASVANAELEQAKANLTLAKAKYARAIDLQGKGFISGQAKDEADNNLKVSEAAVALAEAKLAKLTIVAPFSGIIGLRSVSVGDYVKEGTDLVNLEAIDPLKVDFRVAEIYFQRVEIGQFLQIALDALPGKTFEGRVYAVNPLIDAAGRSVVIRATVRNQDTSLRPGMFARVRLLTREAQDALIVPEQAIVPQGDEQYVFRVIDGKAVRTKVTVGQRRDGKVEVLQGLASDETVVTAGQLKIRDGVAVQFAGTNGSLGATPVKAEGPPPPLPKT